MKKIKKILMIVVMMLTICVSLTSCNNNNGDTPNTTDLSKLTAKDVFKEINVVAYKAGGAINMKKKVLYSELSSSTSVDPYNSRGLQIDLYASYKFEVTKITLKAQSSWDNHLTSDKIGASICKSENVGKAIKRGVALLNSKELFNIEHTITIEFETGELVVDKGDFFRINTDCNSAMDEDKMRYSNIEVFGKVVVE